MSGVNRVAKCFWVEIPSWGSGAAGDPGLSFDTQVVPFLRLMEDKMT